MLFSYLCCFTKYPNYFWRLTEARNNVTIIFANLSYASYGFWTFNQAKLCILYDYEYVYLPFAYVGFHSLDKLCYLTNHRNILSVWVFYLIFAFFELQLRFNLFFWEVIEIIWIWILFIASVWIDLGSKFSVLIQVKLLSIEPASSYESLSGHASWWSVPTGTVSLWCCTLWIYMKSSVSGYRLHYL